MSSTVKDGTTDLMDADVPVKDFLQLPTGGSPINLAVSVNSSNTGEYIVFTLNSNPPQKARNLAWVPGAYALVLNFALSDRITSIFSVTPYTLLSATYKPAGTDKAWQYCCIPAIAGEYHIAAEVPDLSNTPGSKNFIDPKIVVSPIIIA